jgi:hypothetical protein
VWVTPAVAAVAVDVAVAVAAHHAEAVAVPATTLKITNAERKPSAFLNRDDRRIMAAPGSP